MASRKIEVFWHYPIERKHGVAGDIERTRLAIGLNVVAFLPLSAEAANALAVR